MQGRYFLWLWVVQPVVVHGKRMGVSVHEAGKEAMQTKSFGGCCVCSNGAAHWVETNMMMAWEKSKISKLYHKKCPNVCQNLEEPWTLFVSSTLPKDKLDSIGEVYNFQDIQEVDCKKDSEAFAVQVNVSKPETPSGWNLKFDTKLWKWVYLNLPLYVEIRLDRNEPQDKHPPYSYWKWRPWRCTIFGGYGTVTGMIVKPHNNVANSFGTLQVKYWDDRNGSPLFFLPYGSEERTPTDGVKWATECLDMESSGQTLKVKEECDHHTWMKECHMVKPQNIKELTYEEGQKREQKHLQAVLKKVQEKIAEEKKKEAEKIAEEEEKRRIAELAAEEHKKALLKNPMLDAVCCRCSYSDDWFLYRSGWEWQLGKCSTAAKANHFAAIDAVYGLSVDGTGCPKFCARPKLVDRTFRTVATTKYDMYEVAQKNLLPAIQDYLNKNVETARNNNTTSQICKAVFTQSAAVAEVYPEILDNPWKDAKCCSCKNAFYVRSDDPPRHYLSPSGECYDGCPEANLNDLCYHKRDQVDLTPAIKDRLSKKHTDWTNEINQKEKKKKMCEALFIAAEKAEDYLQIFEDGWQTAEDPASGKTYYYNRDTNVRQWNWPGTETESSLLGLTAKSLDTASLNASDSQESANSLKKQKKTLQTQNLQVLGLSRALAPDRVNDIISKYYHPDFAHQAKQKLVNGIGTGNEASVFRSIDISLQLPQGVLDHDQKRSVNVVDGQKNILSPNGEKFRIYAAGIADNSAFEESMAEAGCEVHAFDCTISHQANAVAGKKFTFHETCLGVPASFENNGYTAHQNKTYEFKLLSQAMAELGHKSIDILKFDIEGFEWNLFETDLLKEEVLPKQLAFELHTENANPQYVPPQQVKDKDATAVNTLFLKLYDLGYRVVSKEVNPGDEHCAEFVLVNINEALIALNALGDQGPISAPQNAVTSLTSLKTWQDPRIDSIIPDRLVGNYYINFMKRSTDIDDFQKVGGEGMSWKLERMRANIKATMKINHFTEKQIEWADDQDCADLIEHLHSKELRAAFAREQRGEYKSDICRLAQLAENGGYYVDNDMAALEAIHQYIPAHASFVSVIAAWNSFGDRDLQGENTKNIRDEMFNSFIGVAPGHPIIQKALNLTLEHYSDAQKQKEQSALVEIRSERSNWLLGPYILRQAYEWWADLPLGASISLAESYHPTKPTKFQYSYLLDETKIDNEYVVRDHKTGTTIFKSRIEVLS